MIPTLRADKSKSPAPLSRNRWLGVFMILIITLFSFWLAVNPTWTEWAGTWGYFGAFIISLIASATIVLPAPGIAIVIAMGAALDPIALGLVAGLGSAFGEMSGYIAGATGRELVEAKNQKQFERVRQATEKHGAFFLFLMAALPVPLFDLAGIVAGALKMRVLPFFTAVAIGKSIKYITMIMVSVEAIPLLQEWFERLSLTW